jgi:hypothetical protein
MSKRHEDEVTTLIRRCEWCAAASPPPVLPCSSAAGDRLRAFYSDTGANERCKQEIAKRLELSPLSEPESKKGVH